MEIERDEGWQDAVDELGKFADQGRAPAAKIREILDTELTADRIQELADEIRASTSELRERAATLEEKADLIDEVGGAFEGFAEAVLAAVDLVDELEGAEGRDDKRDAKEALLEGLVEIVERHGDTLNHDLDEVMDGIEEGFSYPKLWRIVWKDGSPNFIDRDGYDIEWPEGDTFWQ